MNALGVGRSSVQVFVKGRDGTQTPRQQDHHQDGSQQWLRQLRRFAEDEGGEEKRTRAQVAHSKGGLPASRTRSRTGAIVSAPKHADETSGRHLEVEIPSTRPRARGYLLAMLFMVWSRTLSLSSRRFSSSHDGARLRVRRTKAKA